MLMNKIGNSDRNSEGISDQLQQVILNSIRNMLPDNMIEQTCREIGYTFRRRKITPVVTVLHMVMAALWPVSWDIYEQAFVKTFAGFFHGNSKHLFGITRFRGATRLRSGRLQSP